MSIEDVLREAARKGLTHLTLWPTFSEDRKNTYWKARATPSTMHSYVETYSEDPVEALEQVLRALPNAHARTRKRLTAKVKGGENDEEDAA